MCSKWLIYRIKKLYFRIKQKMITAKKRTTTATPPPPPPPKKKKDVDAASCSLSFNK